MNLRKKAAKVISLITAIILTIGNFTGVAAYAAPTIPLVDYNLITKTLDDGTVITIEGRMPADASLEVEDTYEDKHFFIEDTELMNAHPALCVFSYKLNIFSDGKIYDPYEYGSEEDELMITIKPNNLQEKITQQTQKYLGNYTSSDGDFVFEDTLYHFNNLEDNIGTTINGNEISFTMDAEEITASSANIVRRYEINSDISGSSRITPVNQTTKDKEEGPEFDGYSVKLSWKDSGNIIPGKENEKLVHNTKPIPVDSTYVLTIATSASGNGKQAGIYNPGELEIRVPLYWWEKRSLYNEETSYLEFSEISIPEAPATGNGLKFNYTLDDNGTTNVRDDEIVIKNYEKVEAGTTTTIEVKYTIDPMRTYDMSKAVIDLIAKGKSITDSGYKVVILNGKNALTYTFDTGSDSLEYSENDNFEYIYSKDVLLGTKASSGNTVYQDMIQYFKGQSSDLTNYEAFVNALDFTNYIYIYWAPTVYSGDWNQLRQLQAQVSDKNHPEMEVVLAGVRSNPTQISNILATAYKPFQYPVEDNKFVTNWYANAKNFGLFGYTKNIATDNQGRAKNIDLKFLLRYPKSNISSYLEGTGTPFELNAKVTTIGIDDDGYNHGTPDLNDVVTAQADAPGRYYKEFVYHPGTETMIKESSFGTNDEREMDYKGALSSLEEGIDAKGLWTVTRCFYDDSAETFNTENYSEVTNDLYYWNIGPSGEYIPMTASDYEISRIDGISLKYYQGDSSTGENIAAEYPASEVVIEGYDGTSWKTLSTYSFEAKTQAQREAITNEYGYSGSKDNDAYGFIMYADGQTPAAVTGYAPNKGVSNGQINKTSTSVFDTPYSIPGLDLTGQGITKIRVRTPHVGRGGGEVSVNTMIDVKHDSPTLISYLENNPDADAIHIYNVASWKRYRTMNGSNWQTTHWIDATSRAFVNLSDSSVAEEVVNDVKSINSSLYLYREISGITLSRIETESEYKITIKNIENDKEHKRVIATIGYDFNELYRGDKDTILSAYGSERLSETDIDIQILLPAGWEIRTDQPHYYKEKWGIYENELPYLTPAENSYVMNKTDNYKKSGRQLINIRAKSENAKNYITDDTRPAYTDNAYKVGGYGEITISCNWSDLRYASYLGTDILSQLRTGKIIVGNSSSTIGYPDNTIYNGTALQNAFLQVKDPDNDEIIMYEPNSEPRKALYAYTNLDPNVVMTGETEIKKEVKGLKGIYSSEDSVEPSTDYSYRITVTNNSSQYMKNLYIYDILEEAQNTEGHEGESSWKGVFDGIDLSYLESIGAHPTVYYSTEKGLKYLSRLDKENYVDTFDYYRNRQIFTTTPPADKSKITAICVQIGLSTGLAPNSSLNITIKMKAPVSSDAKYAYNRAAYFCTIAGDGEDRGTVFITGNRTRVELKKAPIPTPTPVPTPTPTKKPDPTPAPTPTPASSTPTPTSKTTPSPAVVVTPSKDAPEPAICESSVRGVLGAKSTPKEETTIFHRYPKTGDSNLLLIFIAGLLVSACGVAIIGFVLKRKK